MRTLQSPKFYLFALSCLFSILVCQSTADMTRQQYEQQRAELIRLNDAYRNDNISLTPKEQQVDAILAQLLEKEEARTAGSLPPAHSFFDMHSVIDASPLLPIFHAMPKGGLLHGHMEAMFDFRWVVQHGTYHPKCYINSQGFLQIFPSPPVPLADWKLVSVLRAAAQNVSDFDEALYRSMTLNKGEESNGEGSHVWIKFQRVFSVVGGVIKYRPITEGYMRAMFDNFRADNIQYYEMRLVAGSLFDDVKAYSVMDEIKFYHDFVATYRQEFPDFDVKLIATSSRHFNSSVVFASMKETLQAIQAFPDFVVGFDLVGEEDTGHTTLFYLEDFLQFKALQEQMNISATLFFHDGESVWANNTNLFDALLMGTRRIGHGFNLFRYPALMKMVKERDVAIEVCPISNQLLKLCDDLRTHPGAIYLANGLPVTINSDDPGLLGYDSVYYDYYEVFVAWRLQLKSLKTLAMNSLIYSAMDNAEKQKNLDIFMKRWDVFIDAVLAWYA